MQRGVLLLAVTILVVFGAALAGWWFAFGHSWYDMHRAKQYIANRLLDPSSATFRNVRIVSTIRVCGEVDGKDRSGAYVGFREFYATPSGTSGMIKPDNIDFGGNREEQAREIEHRAAVALYEALNHCKG